MRILIAEDDGPSRQLLVKHLAAGGYDTLEADDGSRALEALQREGIRILIAGWAAPGMPGLELIRRIRSERQSAYVYCIIATAPDEPSQIVEGLSAGAD